MKYTISGVGELEVRTILFDLNGTLSAYGTITENAATKIRALKEKDFRLVIVSSDQRGNATDMAHDLGIEIIKASTEIEKENVSKTFDKQTTASIGNGRVDIGLFKHSVLSIGIINKEGLHTGILPFVDLLFNCIEDAFEFFLDEDTLKATLKK